MAKPDILPQLVVNATASEESRSCGGKYMCLVGEASNGRKAIEQFPVAPTGRQL